MPFRKAVLSLAVLLLATVPLALAQGTYTQIDVPGAIQTALQGVDNAGDIVGYYEDASATFHGFLLSGGTYTTIDYPGAVSTDPTGVNDAGQVVGVGYDDVGYPYGGFLYDVQTAGFTTITYPGKTTYTWPVAINNAGTIAGYFLIGDDYDGFQFSGSHYGKPFKVPGSAATYVSGITTSGEIVGIGFADEGRLTESFSLYHGKFQIIHIPRLQGFPVLAVNGEGSIFVGDYNAAAGVFAAFLYQNNSWQELLFPGSNSTNAYGVNDSSEVVGWFLDASGNAHGFTWTPPADAAKK
jgi:probable HAF family extracellular repeat protein